MRIDRMFRSRALVLLLTTLSVPVLWAQAEAAPVSEPLIQVDRSLVYAMILLAVVQVVFILSMAGIMRTMSGPGALAKWLTNKQTRPLALLPFLLFAGSEAHAQAYVPDSGTISDYNLFWMLAVINTFLFVIMIAQISVLRGLTKAITGTDDVEEVHEAKGPSWLDGVLKGLTRQVEIEKEKDILMNHEYDGIRELDNVLPPWWLWLFYFTIGWGVVYVINVHVINVLPDQQTEYAMEMEQAKADVAAFMATQKSTVDELTIVLSTEDGVLAGGKAVFTQYCTPCHGADGAGSETSVGPNLTDAYWLHGGGVKDVFKIVKYGVPEKGMISWKSQLKPIEIGNVTNYIMSLKGTGGPAQKAPQGEVWEASGESDVSAGDSLIVEPDTARMAAAQ